MNTILAKATTKETDLIIKLLSELYLELGEEAESINFLNRDLINSVLESGKTEVYFIKNHESVCGIISLTENQALYAGGKYGTLDEMYITPEYRNKNIGETCVEQIIILATIKEWKRIDVTAPTDESERTVNFYKKCGFSYTGPKLKLKID